MTLSEHEKEPQIKLEVQRCFDRHALRGIDNERLGAVVRAFVPVGHRFMQRLKCEQKPIHPWLENPLLAINASPETRAEEQPKIDRLKEKYRTNMEYFETKNNERTLEIINTSNCDPHRSGYPLATVLFEGEKPVLYSNYWYTDDLDDVGRDSCELQVFVALSGFGDGESEKSVIHDYLDRIFDGSKISTIPSNFVTLCTIPDEVFVPFLRVET